MRAILGLAAIALVACGNASPQTTTQETSAAPPAAAPRTQATSESLVASRRTAIVTAAERVAPFFRRIAGQGAVRVYYYRSTGLGSTDFYVRTR